MALLNIALGCESFYDIRKNNCCYIDKTYIIEELLDSSLPMVSLLTRPRRFGKTLTLSMLQEFFDITKNSHDLFAGLSICENENICKNWMDKYPVIFVSFKNIECDSYKTLLQQFAMVISNVISDHDYLFRASSVKDVDKKKLDILLNNKESGVLLEQSLYLLSRALKDCWNKQVIILIDEYDVPLNCAEQNGFFREMVGKLRNVLGSALKTNPSCKFAILTGCLRIAKKSIFTGLNNFKCYGVSDNRFADSFGFTTNEVDELLKQGGLLAKKSSLQEWYDGYCFGRATEIYCPWDVLQYLYDLQYDLEAQPKLYWKNTSGNAIVRTLVSYASQDIRHKVEALLAGEAIEVPICEELTYDSVYEDEKNLWSILYLTGYLTRAAIQPGNADTALRIPNKEVRQIFIETISQWFRESIAKCDLKSFMDALWKGNSAIVQATLTDLLYSTISYFDQAENYYHGFLTGLLRGAGFSVLSNREEGHGLPDIVLEDGRHKRALIIEVKAAKTYHELEQVSQVALRQIQEKQYVSGISPQIRKIIFYGIAFWKKESSVQVLEFNR
ncbi:MAG: ATP-binding protein [Desulfovibrio sp.]|nr:ATP-binding protein [Desulfovibrio sp.]